LGASVEAAVRLGVDGASAAADATNTGQDSVACPSSSVAFRLLEIGALGKEAEAVRAFHPYSPSFDEYNGEGSWVGDVQAASPDSAYQDGLVAWEAFVAAAAPRDFPVVDLRCRQKGPSFVPFTPPDDTH
jgi:hypothetical protein